MAAEQSQTAIVVHTGQNAFSQLVEDQPSDDESCAAQEDLPEELHAERVPVQSASTAVLLCIVCKVSDAGGTKWYVRVKCHDYALEGERCYEENEGDLCFRCGTALEARQFEAPRDMLVHRIQTNKIEDEKYVQDYWWDVSRIDPITGVISFDSVVPCVVGQDKFAIHQAYWKVAVVPGVVRDKNQSIAIMTKARSESIRFGFQTDS